MNEAIISEESNLFSLFGDKFSAPVIFEILHMAIIWISILFIDDGICAISIFESSLEVIAVDVGNFTFSILLALSIDSALINTSIKVLDLTRFGSHQINQLW